MTIVVGLIVVAGIVLSAVVGASGGFDSGSLFLLGLIVGFGALAIAVARKSRTGAIGPSECPECGGLVSAHAPYCKHCGALQK